MSHLSRSNGRPEPEVIVNVRGQFCAQRFLPYFSVSQFADGMAYSKGKMEEAFRQGGLLDKPYKSTKETLHVKRDDVDLIVRVCDVARCRALTRVQGT